MKRLSFGLMATAAAMAFAPAAMAATDYFLKIEGVEGESVTEVEVLSWSWGVSNAGSMSGSSGSGAVASPRDAASGLATGRRQHHPPVTASQNTQSLRGRATVSDLSITRNADMSSLNSVDEIQGFSLTFANTSPVLAKVCNGKHFTTVHLRGRSETFVLENAAVTGCASSSDAGACVSSVGTAGGGATGGASSAAYAATGRSSAPGQCPSPDSSVTTSKQTQGATFGEKVNQGLHAAGGALASGVTLTFTGQLKHTKTGHVTLLK